MPPFEPAAGGIGREQFHEVVVFPEQGERGPGQETVFHPPIRRELAQGAVSDTAGNAGPASVATVASSITIDVTPPGSASFTSGPSGPIAVTSATFAFTGATADDHYECQVDGAGAWSACTSPKSFASLADGPHSIAVRLVDEVGNAGTPATRSFDVDTAAPTSTASITSAIPADGSSTTSTGATFDFTGADPGEGYSCRLDAGAWADCTSPEALTGLADGTHVFAVATEDAAGNRGPVASRTWTVDTAPPTVAPAITTEMICVTMEPPTLSEIQPPTGRMAAPMKGPIQA